MFRDGHAIEQRRIGWWIAAITTRWRGFKEVADHAQVQGFAEAPGAGDEMHLAGMINKICDKMGFIDKIAVFTDEFLEIGDALFQFLFHDDF